MKKIILVVVAGLLAVTMFLVGYRSVPVAFAANSDIPPVPENYERLVPLPGANWGGAVLGGVFSDGSIFNELNILMTTAGLKSANVDAYEIYIVLYDYETSQYRQIEIGFNPDTDSQPGMSCYIRSYSYNNVNSAYAWEISFNPTSAQYSSGDFTPFYDDSYWVYFHIVAYSFGATQFAYKPITLFTTQMQTIYNALGKIFNEYVQLYVPKVEPPKPSQSEIDAAYNAGYTAGLNQNQVGANADLIAQNNALQSQISDLTSQNTQLNQNYNTLNSQYTQLQNSVDLQIQQSHTSGYNSGYSAGIAAGGQNNFLSLMSAVVDAPLQAFAGIFDLEILGFNMKNFLLGVVSVAFTAMIARFALRLFA